MAEQNFRFAAPLADRHYVVERGRVVEMVEQNELSARMNVLHEYLGV
jgi:branched-chain amino acid transport system ATP-binding protein